MGRFHVLPIFSFFHPEASCRTRRGKACSGTGRSAGRGMLADVKKVSDAIAESLTT